MRKKIIIIFGFLFVFLISLFLLQLVNLSPIIFQLLFNKEITLKKNDDHVNILLLGISGGAHEGPNLTDSIIFGSLDQQNNKVTIVSVPRDLWIPDLNAKINIAYASGEAKRKGGGLILAKAAASKVLGQPIDYSLRINFAGFTEAIDQVGGIDVYINNSFDDFEYPIEDKEKDLCGRSEREAEILATASSQLEAFPCRYKHIRFEKGLQHFDGSTALEFVRSRHAIGTEGTDFARSKRQERVILAFKTKVLSLETLINPFRLIALYNTLSKNIDTDIPQSSFDDFIRLSQKMKNAKIENTVLDYGDKREKRAGLLINPLPTDEYRQQWVLIPRTGNGNFKEIQDYVSCQITKGNCPLSEGSFY